MNRYCIVVPIYKEQPDLIDKVSLEQLIRIHGNKDIMFICPDELDIKAYNDLVKPDHIRFFDKKYFTGTAAYSQLLVSMNFYNLFKELKYDYILIYQTDCYLLKDDIQEWIDKGYDYIGAPIVTNSKDWTSCPCTGNGGLSLRKVQTFIDICNPNGKLLKKHSDILKPETVEYEDLYFCRDVYNIYDFSKPRCKEAASFSIDMNPDVVRIKYLDNKELPMGIHAWDKNIHYWKTIINEFNDDGLLKACDTKYADSKTEWLKLYYMLQKNKYTK